MVKNLKTYSMKNVWGGRRLTEGAKKVYDNSREHLLAFFICLGGQKILNFYRVLRAEQEPMCSSYKEGRFRFNKRD